MSFRPQDTVRNPRATDRSEEHRTAISTDDRRRQAFGHAQSAVVGAVIQVEKNKSLQPVEAEALPHLHAEEVRQPPRVAEECFGGGFAAFSEAGSGGSWGLVGM